MKKWGDRRDLNPRVPEPQSGALTTSPRPPLSLGFIHYILAGVVGIEPTSKVLETFVLPLNYTPSRKMVVGERFELPNPMGADLQSAAFSHFATPPYLKVAQDGIEPPTQGFSVLCSTD